jgi:hypothetical protein
LSFSKDFDFSNFSGTIYPAGGGRTGPKTPQGKAIAARNATSHGLFARDIVLTQLGEDPAGYTTLYHELCQQIDPRNLIERHYVEEIAAASWRLRRLHRWQAQVYEDETLTEDERLDKLDRVLRHETALHRQIDKSVRLLGRDVPLLFEGRARKQALAELEQTERSCRLDESVELDVALRARDNLQFASFPLDFDRERLDNTHTPAPAAPAAESGEATPPSETQICQNEMPPPDKSNLPNAPAPEPLRPQERPLPRLTLPILADQSPPGPQ